MQSFPRQLQCDFIMYKSMNTWQVLGASTCVAHTYPIILVYPLDSLWASTDLLCFD